MFPISLNDETNNINVYVGEEDGKLHFVDKDGADTVLNFKSSGSTIYGNDSDALNIMPKFKTFFRADYYSSSYSVNPGWSNGSVSLTLSAPSNGGNCTYGIVFPYLLDFSKIESFVYEGQDWSNSTNLSYLISKDFNIDNIKGSYYGDLYPNYDAERILKHAFGSGCYVKGSEKNIKVSSDGQVHTCTVDYSDFNDYYYFGVMYFIYGASTNGSGSCNYENFRFTLK